MYRKVTLVTLESKGLGSIPKPKFVHCHTENCNLNSLKWIEVCLPSPYLFVPLQFLKQLNCHSGEKNVQAPQPSLRAWVLQ